MGGFVLSEVEFERILEKYSDRIFALAMAKTGNRKDAEDVFKDSFVKLYRSRIEFLSDDHIQEWLIDAASNCSISIWKSFKNRQQSRKDRIDFSDAADAAIWHEIEDLPQEYSVPIHLRYYEGYSAEKIQSVISPDFSDTKARLSTDNDILNILNGSQYSWDEYGYRHMAENFHAEKELIELTKLAAMKNTTRSLFEFNRKNARIFTVTVVTLFSIVIAVSIMGNLIRTTKGRTLTSDGSILNVNDTSIGSSDSEINTNGTQTANGDQTKVTDTNVIEQPASALFTNTVSSDGATGIIEDDSQPYWNVNFHNFAKGDNVYYYLDSNNLTKTPYLMYFDPATAITQKLCSKEGCNHATGECNAYLLSNQDQSIWYYKGFIYLLNTTETATVLERVNIDGSGRCELFEIGKPYNQKTQIFYNLVFDNDSVYIYERLPSGAKGVVITINIRCRSLDGKTDKIIYSESGEMIYITNVRSVAGRLFFMVNHYEYTSSSSSLMSMGIYSYDSRTGEISNILNKSIIDYEVDARNNMIYYYVYNDGMYAFNISTKENTKIFTSTYTVKYNSKMSFDGKYIYLIANDNLLVIGTDGTLINTIPIGISVPNIYFGDRDYIFASLMMVNDTLYIYQSGVLSNTVNGAKVERKNVFIKKSDISTATGWTILK